MKLSRRISKTELSATIAMSMKARELKAQGRDILALTAGEPDFDTPDFIKDAAIAAIKEGKTKYTPVDGTKTLKSAIINKFKKENNLSYTEDQIIVSSGCKQSIYNLCQAYLEEGDEVLIPAPCWVSYPEIVKLSGANPVIIKTKSESNFKLDKETLERSINSKTKMIMINSPCNPTGAVYTKSELSEICSVLKKHENILIASDDIYEHIIFNGEKFYNILSICPELEDRTVILNGVSKAYAMTGWRIGYTAGNIKIINAMKKIQSQSTSCPCSIAQYAAEEALNNTSYDISHMVKEYKARADFLYESLNKIEGIVYTETNGAFYAFPNVSGLIKNLKNVTNDTELCEYLLENAGVAVVPGSSFGVKDHVRISFATSLANLDEAISRIKKASK